MPNSGFWEAGLEGTADRLNAALLQYDVAASRPAAGQTGRQFFATDTKELSRDNGTSWNTIIPPSPIFKTGDETVSSSTTLQDDDDLKVSVGANEKWNFRLVLRLSAANTTPDIKITWSVPGGAGSLGGWWRISDLVAGAGLPLENTNITAELIAALDTSERNQVFEGFLIVGATAGTLQLRWAQSTSDAGVTTVHAESHLMFWRSN